MKKIVIIGAGLGGLTSGALLAKDGCKVTLLEQHNIVGGCATTFKRGDFICEVGLHEMDGVYTNPQIKKIFDRLGIYENVNFLKIPEFFEVTTKSGSFKMPEGVEEAKSALSAEFPNEKEAIEKYFGILEEITTSLEALESAKWYHYLLFPFYFPILVKYKSKSVTEVMEEIFEDERLQLILNANVQYYNDIPETLSFLLHAVAQYSYYRGGGYFIQGGSGRLSDYLASIIKQNKGEVITKANVVKCTPTSVTYECKKTFHTIEADAIISNLSPNDTYKLFGVAYQESKVVADSLLTIYIGFSKNLRSIYGERAYSNIYQDEIESSSEIKELQKKDLSQRGFVFVDYSQIDAKLTKTDGKSFGVICMADYIKEWQELPKEEYKQKKLNLQETMVARLEKYYPNISKYIEYIETGTAKTVQDYIKTPKGTAYGYKATPKQFLRIPRSRSKKIDNLYFVGQWVIAGGFSPTITSGNLCYEEIKKRMIS